jgi:alpha-L-arabinofuranosidase
MNRSFAVIIVILVAGPAAFAASPDSSIKIDAGKVHNRVTPLMYGSCIEDVNHEIYGGLYSQMIFGESFEEPPREPVSGWFSHGGDWTIHEGVCSVKADAGAKLVWNDSMIADGNVECDVRLDDDKGDNAGLILRTHNPQIGANAFIGYEVSLSARGQYLRLGRHRNNWELIQDVPASVKPNTWHHLRVELAAREIRVFVDGAKTPAIRFTDDAPPIKDGKVGLRTWHSNASFRNLSITTRASKYLEQFTAKRVLGDVSALWDRVLSGGPESRFAWDAEKPFNSARSQKIEFVHGEGTVGIANRGLNRWGLSVRQGQMYPGRLYLRGSGYGGKVIVALQSDDGKRTYARDYLGPPGADWKRYEFNLKPSETDASARFAVLLDEPGAVWVDQVYLSGTGDDLFHGLPIRGDIGRMLQEEGLTVLRYGGSMVNAEEYRWKKMIGDRDKRPQYKGWWYPYSTNGFGIEEFLQFCEAAKFEKVFAINVEETPEDAGDLVEYLNGPATSEWGGRRAKNGHPAPYGAKYIEIGNEETTNEHYLERFKLLYDAMHARDPSVQFIIAAWWEPDNPVSRRIVQELDDKAAMWDVHVGGDDLHEGRNVDALFTRMEKLLHEWAPKTSLKACVLEENGGRHDLQRALGHACVLNATERHGDFVLIDCPANCLQPWQQNDDGWDQGQVFFTSSQVWGMPPFYSQQMAAANHLPCRVASEAKSPNDELDVTATRSDDGSALVLKVVNIGGKPHSASLEIAGLGSIASEAEVTTLSGKLSDINPPDAPSQFHSVHTTFDKAAEHFEYEFPAYSYTILKLKRKP